MNTPKNDYTHKGWLAASVLIAVLVAVSFVPPQSLGGVKLRRANILADLIDFRDVLVEGDESTLFNEADFNIDMNEVTELIETDTAPRRVQTSFEWVIPSQHVDPRRAIPYITSHTDTQLVPIEEYDKEQRHSMRAFCDTLLHAHRPVRIAFMGDSFIEGDILTADLRELLQETFGGGGPGFTPMASPLTAFRRSVKTQSKGWSSYNIMQRRAAPEELRNNFYISGWVCQPSPLASTRWENTSFRRRLDDCTQGRILFISKKKSLIEVTINDTLRREFEVAGDAAVRQITISAPHIHSLEFKVVKGNESFVGYGALLEGNGVVVDNYSIRSNNGQAMFWTNPSINAQINALLGYDLVILQYGLNIMQNGVKNYTSYAAQIGKMVAYARECFPSAAILVMGVSDRSVKTGAGFVAMDAVPHMISYQRKAAEAAGVAFWPTSDAMRAEGGMKLYVHKGWAGKDYTHINYAGGRQIAQSLFQAINAGAREAYTEHQHIETRKRATKAILDTLHFIKYYQQRPRPAPTSSPNEP